MTSTRKNNFVDADTAKNFKIVDDERADKRKPVTVKGKGKGVSIKIKPVKRLGKPYWEITHYVTGRRTRHVLKDLEEARRQAQKLLDGTAGKQSILWTLNEDPCLLHRSPCVDRSPATPDHDDPAVTLQSSDLLDQGSVDLTPDQERAVHVHVGQARLAYDLSGVRITVGQR